VATAVADIEPDDGGKRVITRFQMLSPLSFSWQLVDLRFN